MIVDELNGLKTIPFGINELKSDRTGLTNTTDSVTAMNVSTNVSDRNWKTRFFLPLPKTFRTPTSLDRCMD